MPSVVSIPSQESRGRLSLAMLVRAERPSLAEMATAIISATLLVVSFPDFNLWPLAWFALIPLLVVIARKPQPWRTFILGWLFGSTFFYGSCYWLTYSMIHFGGIPPFIAFMMLIPGALLMGIFPGVFTTLLALAMRKWGQAALYTAPFLWPTLEWARLWITGQLWNALGYSQAYHPSLIQSARWGGVYAVGFLIVFVNAAITFALLRRTGFALAISVTVTLLLSLGVWSLNSTSSLSAAESNTDKDSDAVVVAIQPNVPMDMVKSADDMRKLSARHFEMSESALEGVAADAKPRLLIWPESPMNFAYGGDSMLRERLADFAKTHNTLILLNSQEVAPNDGIYNSALLINQEGSLAAQYDKIRLMPFGEYVPLPHWVPGAGLISAIVGDFTPGTNYRLMAIGSVRAGIFICIESAYPSIARTFTFEGADVLINISNDGYLGPTAVMRQHLANAVFRAVENDRPLLRVTNTGITAYITPHGEVRDATPAFQPAVRIWTISRLNRAPTFYAAHGDVFVAGCAIVSLLVFVLSFKRSPHGQHRS